MRCILVSAAVVACRTPAPRLVPIDVHYITRADWRANAPVLPMRPHRIERITIHHTAVAQNRERSAQDKLLALQRFSQRDDGLADGRRKPAWADVPYHFYVAVDGAVVEGREWRYVGDTNTEYDPTGHLLIVLEGNFNSEHPTGAQRRALDMLVPAFATRFRVPADRIAGHKDYASTSCPGANLYAELPRLRALADSAHRAR